MGMGLLKGMPALSGRIMTQRRQACYALQMAAAMMRLELAMAMALPGCINTIYLPHQQMGGTTLLRPAVQSALSFLLQIALSEGFDLVSHRFLPRLEAPRLPNSPVQQDGDSFNQSGLQQKRQLVSYGKGFPPSVARQQQELPHHSGSMKLSRRHETQLETISKQLESLTALVAAHGQLLESMGKHVTEQQHD